MPFPKALTPDPYSDPYYNGTFVQFGTPATFGGVSDMGIRAIIMVGDKLWVSDEDLGVSIFDSDGYQVGNIKFKKAVGLVYSEHHNLVFVSSRKGKVYAYKADNWDYKYKLPDPVLKWKHPTGLAVMGDTLIVADQYYGEVYSYDVKKNEAKFTGTLVTGLNRVEQITVSQC